MQKGGPLKFLTLVRGGPEKNTTDFPLKIEFTRFWGWPVIFIQKGGPEIFLRSEGGGGQNFFSR